MSDTPLGPHWWQAGDGKWYPAPPGLADDRSSRAPTPPPDHLPEPPTRRTPLGVGVYGAGRVGALPDDAPERRRRGTALAVAVVAVFLVVALVAGVFELVSRHSAPRASSSDPSYQQAIVDLLDSESTNYVFLETFWDDYTANLSSGGGGSNQRSGRSATITIDSAWLDDMQAQVDQFAADLADIEQSLDDRPWRDGTVPDTIRDLASEHYRTWQQWTARIPELVRKWIATGPTTDLSTYIDRTEPQLESDIERTFDALCSTLWSTAPSDGRFDSTIDGICVP